MYRATEALTVRVNVVIILINVIRESVTHLYNSLEGTVDRQIDEDSVSTFLNVKVNAFLELSGATEISNFDSSGPLKPCGLDIILVMFAH